MRALSILTCIILTLASTGCDSSIEKVVTFPSPDSTYVLVVVTELQAANDPTPWWTHISLRRPEDNLKKIPGNVLELVGRGEILAEWQNSATACIQLPDDIVYSGLNQIPKGHWGRT